MAGEWLSLSEVAKILGVHPSTVRNWTDQGALPAHRTKGGHRRFRQGEIDLWMQSQRMNGAEDTGRILSSAIRRVRLQISDGRMEEESWYQKLDQAARDQYRQISKSLILGLAANLTTDSETAAAEARALGYDYASIGRRHGLSSVEAVHAFLFFRNALLDSILTMYEAAAVGSPQAWGDMLRNVNNFTDHIMIKLLENYHVYDQKR